MPKDIVLICSGCDNTTDRLDECLKCGKKFCRHCVAYGYCEPCIEELGLIAGNLEEFLEQQKKKLKPMRFVGDRYYLRAIQACIRMAKGEQLP